MKKVLRPVIDEAKRLGFGISRTKSDHFRLHREGCQDVFISSTPSDPRSVKNMIALLRRTARSERLDRVQST